MSMKVYFHGSRLVHIDPTTRTRLKDLERAEAADWLPVDSSNVKSICWRASGEGQRKGLGIWFDPKKNGRSTGKETVYWYPTAPYDAYLSLKYAPSKGEHVHAVIIRHYPHVGPFQPPG